MKISCQSCHSKYNVADDKVQGKIVKIRCRKCGATIVVNASAGAATNGSLPPPAAAPAVSAPPASAPATNGAEWHVSVTDADQRTMSQADLVNAYRTGVVVQDTFVWTEGMDDWKALSDVEALASALQSINRRAAEHASAAAAHEAVAAAPIEMFPASAPAAYGPPAPSPAAAVVQAAVAAPAQEPKRAAVKREARSRDLFATRTGEELRTGGAADGSAVDDGRLTGQRNENSVLFSLEHLTKNTEERAHDEPLAKGEDSGIIDLKALAEKAESMRPASAIADASPLTAPLGFSAPLGGPTGGFGSAGSERRSRSKLPILLGVGAAVILLPVLGVVIGLRLGGTTTPAGASSAASATASQTASATAAASADTAASASASAAAQASASGSTSAQVAATMPKARPYGSGAWHAANGAGGPAPKGPAGGGAPAAGGGGAAAGGGAPSPAPAGKKNDCNCNGDLMCMMKCSTH